MNPLTLGMDGLLAALLIAAVVTGVRLSGRLKALREGQAGFATAVADLDAAAHKADRALKSLHAACEGAHDDLLARIEAARALALKLEKATEAAGKAAVRAEEAAARAARVPQHAPPPSYQPQPGYTPDPGYASKPAFAPQASFAPPSAQPLHPVASTPSVNPPRRSLTELLAAREQRSPLRGAEPRPVPEPAAPTRRRLTADEDLFGDDEDVKRPRGRLGPPSMARGR